MSDEQDFQFPQADEIAAERGFYWITIDDAWQVAMWDGEKWWLCGSNEPVEKFGVEAIGERVKRRQEI